MTENEQSLVLIPDLLASPDLLKIYLRRAGVRITQVNTPSKGIPLYKVAIPRDVHIILGGDALSYTKHNAPTKNTLFAYNRESMGIMAALAEHERATVLVGTSELDAIDAIHRHDHDTYDAQKAVRKLLTQLIAEGVIVHSAVLSGVSGIEVSDEAQDRCEGLLNLDRDYIVTHAGISYGIWDECGLVGDAHEFASVLNHDLIVATEALRLKGENPALRLYLPHTVTASKYVYRHGYDTVSSPTSADPRELHSSWGEVEFQTPPWAQFRAHSSVDIHSKSYQGRRFPLEVFTVGGQPTRGIIPRLSPIISIHPKDAGVEIPSFVVSGIVRSPLLPEVVDNRGSIVEVGVNAVAGQTRILSKTEPFLRS